MIRLAKRFLLRCLPPTWAGRLRTWRIRRLIQNFASRIVEHSYGGNRLKIYLADPLAQGWYDNDWPPLPEIVELQDSCLRTGAKVFDIGAHQGVVAAMLALTVGPHGLVVALEASAHNCAIAARNRQLNGLSQIEIVQAAIADKPGRLYFNEGLNGQIDDGSGAIGRVCVDAVTLDGLAEKFGLPDVVFIDVEGAECLALAGGTRVLESGADFFIEVHVGCGLEKLGGSVDDLLSYFPKEQFEILARSEGDSTFCLSEPNEMPIQDRFFIIARRRRVHSSPR